MLGGIAVHGSHMFPPWNLSGRSLQMRGQFGDVEMGSDWPIYLVSTCCLWATIRRRFPQKLGMTHFLYRIMTSAQCSHCRLQGLTLVPKIGINQGHLHYPLAICCSLLWNMANMAHLVRGSTYSNWWFSMANCKKLPRLWACLLFEFVGQVKPQLAMPGSRYWFTIFQQPIVCIHISWRNPSTCHCHAMRHIYIYIIIYIYYNI
jgi:hypothetical protein